jgi:multidrug resistance efflux pump
MEERETNSLYSGPVNEIMGHPPGRILRWGTSVIFVVFILFIFFAWLIKYPDIIPSSVEITTVNPPVTLVSKVTGRIKHLYVSDKEITAPDQLIAVMETAASVDEILNLDNLIDTVVNPGSMVLSGLPEFTQLGEIQNYWGIFRKNLSDYNNYLQNNYYGFRIQSINDEITGLLTYLEGLRAKEKLFSENQLIETRKYKRDSALYVSRTYSETDLEKSFQSLLKVRSDLIQVKLDISSKEIELAERRQMLQDYKIERVEEKDRIFSVLNESFLNLKAQLKIWESTYLLISPFRGTVTFTKFWSENQTVNKDEPVLSIVPLETGDYVGRIYLKMNRSGKVRTGQVVNIKLSGYPYLEYGMVKGVVRSKSLVPSGDSYIIEVSLPSGLTTTYGEKLDLDQNMKGTAEIITDNLNLLQRITNPFRYLVSKYLE